MNRILIFSVAFLAVLAGGYHWHVARTQTQIAADEHRLRREITAERQHLAALARDLDDARRERERNARASVPSPAVPIAAKASAPSSPTAAPDPAVLRLRVQAFASDLRLRYASVLRRAGFDAEKLQAFDRIQTAYLEVTLDKSQDDAARAQARAQWDEQLRELFGDAHAQWLEATRNEPARTAVMQIVQQTFSAAGALTPMQVDELTPIFAAHRTPPTAQSDERYDWEPIIAASRDLLTPRQREAFIAAIDLRRATEKMNALARKKS